MTAEKQVFDALMTYAPLTALIGDRLYPMVLPDGVTLPAAVYLKVSAPRLHTLTGQAGLATVRVQVTTWAKSYREVKVIAEAMRLAFANNLPEAEIIGDRDKFEADTGLYGVDMDVSFMHSEPKL